VTLAVLITLLASVVGYVIFLRPQAEASGVLYQDPVSRGPSPFTQPAVDQQAASVGASTGGSEETPQGPFGGSGILAKCNKELLIKFLNSHPDRKAAWAQVLGVRAKDFDQYVESLRSATLTVDTRVTNHGFKNGRAFELQSILAKGTAVLVDPDGQIVTRCYCGNPLTPPKPQGSSTCTGCPRGYSPPRQCAGTECYQLESAEQTEDASAQERTSAARSAAQPSRSQSTRSQPVPGKTPTVHVFNGQTSNDGDQEETGDENNGSSNEPAQPEPEREPEPEPDPENAPCGEGGPC
jgi:hypothetical protein